MLTALLFSHPQASELDSAGVAEALALALLSPQQLPVGVARDFERHARAAELPLATRLDVLTSALSALGFGRRPPQPTPPGRA
jgi:hypothetical protein